MSELDPSADPSPLFADILHDQAAIEVRGKAKVIAAFHAELIARGMPEFEALELTRDFQRDFLAPIREAREKLHDDREREDREHDSNDEDEPGPGA